jgi:predicted AlkP superfamily phosphohydrolase/phosphomutase
VPLFYIDPGSIYTVGSGLAAVLAFLASIAAVLAVHFRRFLGRVLRHWRLIAASLAGLAIVGSALWFGLSGAGRRVIGVSTSSGRFIIVGFDGLSPNLVDRYLAEGKLPSFKRLKEMGGYTRLATSNPAESPVAWSVFATGRNPGKNGVYDFIRRAPGSYMPDLSLTRIERDKSQPVRKGKAFWQYSRDTGTPVRMIACPVTFPPDEINGEMLSGMGTPDLLGTQGTFSFFTTAPETVTAETGGEVHVVARGDVIKGELLGPRRQTFTGKVERLAAPFEVRPAADRRSATISLQGKDVALGVGEWSPWREVSFKVGPLRTMKGIVRFWLGELEPDLKLFATPICIDPRDPWFAVSYPGDYAARLAKEVGLFSTRGMPFDTWALNEGRLSEDAFIEHARSLLEERERIMDRELARTERGVFFAYFDYPDIIQHMYWRFLDTAHPLYDASAPDKQRGMIESCYREMDRILGKTLDAMHPGDTVVVLSDHGFDTYRRSAHVNSWLRAHGYLVLKSDAGPEGRPLFADVDWSRTRAYALGFGGVYLNLAGREPQGVVTAAEAEPLKSEIAKGLAGWRDDKDGAAMVHTVYLQQDIFKGPDAAHAPDLYLGFNIGFGASWQTALGGVPQALVEDNLKKWSGTHLVDPSLVPGVLLTSRPIKIANPSLYDLTPTILRFMGLDDAALSKEDLDGKPLF